MLFSLKDAAVLYDEAVAATAAVVIVTVMDNNTIMRLIRDLIDARDRCKFYDYCISLLVSRRCD